MLWVLPTRRGWLALAAAAASFSIAMVNLSLTATVLSALLWAILPASFLSALFSLHGLTLRREPLQDGEMGRLVPMPVTIANTLSRHRQAVLVGERIPFAEAPISFTPVTPLKPRESRYVRRPILASSRGNFELDRLMLRGGDPAGLFYRQKTFSFPRHMVVYPPRVALHHVPLQLRNRSVASATGQPIGVSGLGQEFFGVRPYRPTDGMRFIHWKASARQQELMVREFEETTIQQVTIILDNHRANLQGKGLESNFELQVKVAASLMGYLSGVYCRLLFATGTGDKHYLLGSGPTMQTEIMQLLATLQPGDVPLLDVLEQAVDQIPPSTVVYCLTMTDPAELEQELTILLQQRVDLRCVYAPPANFSKRLRLSKKPSSSALSTFQPIVLNPETNIAQVLSHG